MLQTVLLAVHISGGTLALLSGAVAIVVQAVRGRHRVHVVAGRLFVVGMLMVVVAAVPLAVLVDSVLLGLIAVFSAYLMLTGWRFALNRRGRPGPLDWTLAGLMLAFGLAMIAYGIVAWADQGVILVVFGATGILLAVGHLRILRTGGVKGRLRIGDHLQFMTAAYIAALTAFLVVNSGPLGIVAWFLPTVALTPMIIVWKRRIIAGATTTLDRPRRQEHGPKR